VKIEVLCLFPDLVRQVASCGMPQRAVASGALTLEARSLRDTALRDDGRVDGRAFGGGPGMVLEAEPLAQSIEAARARLPRARVAMLSPQGERFDQAWAQRLASEPELVLVCGRYEGVDERAMSTMDFELSLGDFVLSGGELAAMVVVDAIARLLPGVLGDEESAQADSFVAGRLDHPHYTRPAQWRGRQVPEALLSGDHERIRRWRLQRSLAVTWLKRPELLKGLELTAEQRGLLREFIRAGATIEDEV
jgi:tRNA (Guanine37-N(1)-) methyltransferase (EC 2.1.1.31)